MSEYLSLPYTTEVDEWDEILPAVEDAKRLWIGLAVERGRPIPESVGVTR